MSSRIDIAGQRFGRLVVLSKERTCKFTSGIVWKCLRDCGNTYVETDRHLRQGHADSCGCLREAGKFARGTNINHNSVPFEISKIMRTRTELAEAIKQAR